EPRRSRRGYRAARSGPGAGAAPGRARRPPERRPRRPAGRAPRLSQALTRVHPLEPRVASPSPLRRALLAGATGLVGRAMLPMLARGHASVDLLLRRAVPGLADEARVRTHVVDFARLEGHV